MLTTNLVPHWNLMNQGLPGERVRGADDSGRPAPGVPTAPWPNHFALSVAAGRSAAEPSMGHLP
jgi:hypothetical protein